MRTRRLPKPSLAFCIHRSYCPFPIGRDKRNRASLRGITQARSGTPPVTPPTHLLHTKRRAAQPFRPGSARPPASRRDERSRERCCSARCFAGRKGGGRGGEETFTPGHRGGGRADGRQCYTRWHGGKGPQLPFACVFFCGEKEGWVCRAGVCSFCVTSCQPGRYGGTGPRSSRPEGGRMGCEGLVTAFVGVV